VLSAASIEAFVRALCQVSLEELDLIAPDGQPVMFSLQKLVDVAHYNMNRVRVVWARIWGIFAEHFTKAGCHESLHVSMTAIDLLKQLAMKFLEKDEHANYHFQKEFLKPFETIMANNNSAKIRDMVIRCLSNMIVSKAHNIRSGWKSILVVCSIAAGDRDGTLY
jgi:brefeldin A-inhibited guanine nucleotide-exchange protein